MPNLPPSAATAPGLMLQARVTPAGLTDVAPGLEPAEFAVVAVTPIAAAYQPAKLAQGPAIGVILQVVIPPELVRAPQGGRLLDAQGQAAIPPELVAALGTAMVRFVVPRHLLGPEGLARASAADPMLDLERKVPGRLPIPEAYDV